ncbi:MAG: HzsA-related protein, partial [Planctomycetota bacterium]
MSKSVGLPANFNTYHAMRGTNWNNEIAVISNLRGEPSIRTLYKPKKGEMVTEVDLHFDGDRLMFSSIGSHGRWHLFEMKVDGTGLKQISPGNFPDVDFFDSCYLPNGNIAVTSGAGYQGLPCVGGGSPMASMFLLNPKEKTVRQLTFEQDSDWCPTVLNNGRLVYLRWEYTDTPHYFTRVLFHCNPDGTEQMEYYGSNSYFPNAFFYARPIPGRSGKLVGIAGGHHGIGRSGRMLILDPARSRFEASGVVQEIPGYGKKVPALIKDALVNGVWPQFVHPWPLSEKYHLVASKPSGGSLWGIYLVDVFDNMIPVMEVDGSALLEPIPLQKRKTPPIIPDKVQLGEKYANVYLYDVYTGPGLVGIPRGLVKKLRVIAYHFCYNKTGGHASVGVESAWDVKRILGTVPVGADGSAFFKVPANTPLAVQPLDAEGRALQLMQSWFVAMPGENVSCVGCHDKQNMSPPGAPTSASRRIASDIDPWYGPIRPFSFKCEVQPVLDKYCVGCHDGKDRKKPNFTRNDARSYQKDEAYLALHPFVRRPGPESDYHMFKPMEYHATTSELVQMLRKGHHNVKLDREAWERLYTWIDLNVPWRGKWGPRAWRGQDQRKRRQELAMLYANVDDDPEGEHDRCIADYSKRTPVTPVKPKPLPRVTARAPKVSGWPFDAATAKKRQAAAGAQKSIDLGGGQSIKLVRIPAGDFVMGSRDGFPDERPLSRVKIEQPFWMGATEITNAQYKLFDQTHNSRFIDQQWKDHTTPGYPANQPGQPVIRISWKRAMAFCKWLSDKTGMNVTLPTE